MHWSEGDETLSKQVRSQFSYTLSFLSAPLMHHQQCHTVHRGSSKQTWKAGLNASLEVTQRLGRDSSNWRYGMRSWRCQVVVRARQRASSCVPQPTSAQLLIVTLPGSALPSPAQPCPAQTVNPCQLYSSLPALLPAEPLSLSIILSSYSTSFFTSASPWPRDCCFASFEASLFHSLPESPK